MSLDAETIDLVERAAESTARLVNSATARHLRILNVGYDYAAHAGVPDHHIFGKGAAPTHLAHFVEHEGQSWGECLLFRDRLRADAELARAYESLKVELAARHPQDRAAYTAGKTAFVSLVLAGA